MNDLLLRISTAGRRSQLDEELATGVDPSCTPALGLRARQLTSPSTRHAIAGTIRNLLAAAEEPPEAWPAHGSRPPLRREDVLAAPDDLLEVARRLAAPGAVSAQAVALAARLVWDASSPVYSRRGVTVGDWAEAILRRLPSSLAA
jgi:hypothetical protein